MRIDKENNIIYFDNDEEFYDFCVETYSINRRVRDHRVRKAGWDFSDWYQSNVNEDTKIVILDSDSTILRRGGMVTGRAGITRKINAYRVNPLAIQIKNLSCQRDLLLPRLKSGKLKVKQ